MAFPVILVNNTQGTDGLCSGAGPATALFGVNNGSTDGAGTTVTLSAGTDLSGVATDGSHALYFNDTTAGNRKYTTITGSAGSGGATPTVTVSPALAATVTNKTWAIGGKLATIGGTSSKLLFDNNGAAGDAMPGWTVQMENAHVETIAATFDTRRAGDQTSGPITLKGAAGVVITFSNNGNGFVCRGSYQVFQGFEVRNSNATKTASVAFSTASAHWGIIGVKVSHSTNKFWKALVENSAGGFLLQDCEIGFCANIGADLTGGARYRILNNYIHDCGATAGIETTSTSLTGLLFYGNIIANNTGDGLRMTGASANAQCIEILQNTFYNNTSDGVELTAVDGNGQSLSLVIANNIFANNGAYGLNFSAATDIGLLSDLVAILNNDYFTNSTAATNPTLTLSSSGAQTGDPGFTNAAGGNFSIGTNLRAKGYPVGGTLAIGTGSLTFSFVDIGAAQRDETAQFGYLPVAP
jgi:hypothetical protein